MPLTTGTRLGSYEITAALGSGGMGEVYRARDTKLNRDVAIKVLPDLFAADPNRLARFEREAQALAALNHPNIAHVYGLERHEGGGPDGSAFIVMELVDGEELAARIARGPMALDEALPIAAQIADALEAAHEQGIVHRDLKPANIKVRNDGTVKVLDFGLAKAVDATAAAGSASISPTLTAHATQAGMILGTAAYMSPEQARGRPVDKRADIWAFGVVLYEMVTGRKPFEGEDVGEVLAAVIKDEPSWDRVPAHLRRLLQRCLQKDPKKRLRDISGVALLLEEVPAGVAPPRRLPWLAAAVAATAVVVVAFAIWALWPRARPGARSLIRLDVALGADMPLVSPSNAAAVDALISPDGNRLVWISRNRVFTRRLDQPQAVLLASSSTYPTPFFSSDGQSIAFVDQGKLRRVSVEGGAAITVCDAASFRGGTWADDGTIIASLDGVVLSTVPASGGTPSPLTQLADGEATHRWPQILPGGRAVLLTVRSRTVSYDDGAIDVLSLRDRTRTTLVRGGTFGRYVAGPDGDGFLVYVSRGTLFAAPFDLAALTLRGTPIPVLEDVGYNSTVGSAQFDASRAGTVVYRSGTTATLSLQWLNNAGVTQPLPAKPAAYSQPRLSPSGNLVALSIPGPGGQNLWVYDWQRDVMSRLTSGPVNVFPVWTPDGRFIVFTGGFGGPGIFWTRADGASTPQLLIESKNAQFPWSFSPDGKRLAYAEFLGPGAGDLWTVEIENDGNGLKAGKPELFLRTPASELFPAFSPDGRWIAYRTIESASSEIEVRAFPDRGGKWLISNSGGEVPVWSPNGRELFYRTEDHRIMVVTYSVKDDVFVPDKPRLWSEKRLAPLSGRNLDIAPDGSRFIVLLPSDSAEETRTQSQVTFLENFSDELRRRVGSAK